MLNKKKVTFLALFLLIIGGGIYYLLGRSGTPAVNETPDHLLALIEARAKGGSGRYLTLEEVVTEVRRTGKFPAVLSYYLSPRGPDEDILVRTLGIDVEHVREYGRIEYLDYPFIALNRGYGTTDGVWLVDARDGTILLRAEEGQAMIKEQWDRLVPADHIFNKGTGVEEGPWHGFGILQPFGMSPDGNKLGFFLHSRRGGIFDNAIFVGFLNLQTNTPHFTGLYHPYDVKTWRPRWSPTSAYIYYGNPISRADEPMMPANIDVLSGFAVDSVATGQRSFSLPSLEMVTLLFSDKMRAAKEKYKAPDFGGWGSLDWAIRSTIDFRPWFSNLKWSSVDNSLSFTTIVERAVSEGEYLEAHARNNVKEEFGQAEWSINADGNELRLKSIVHPQ